MHLFLNCLAASAGGGVTYVRNIVPHLAAHRDIRATVALHPNLRQELATLSNVSFLEIGAPKNAARRFYVEQTQLGHKIRQSGADVLISTGNFALRRSPVPQILISGNSLYTSRDFYRDLRRRGEYRMWLDTRLRGYLARRSIHWADRTVAPSQSFTNQLQDWTGRNVVNVHHGFDGASFLRDQTALPHEIQQKLDSTSGMLRLLFVSHYNYYRNFETLLQAIPLVRERLGSDRVRLFLTCTLDKRANPGSYDPSQANSIIHKLDISRYVVQLGTIPYEVLHQIYRACDIYVTPAYAETFAFPLAEAMASGVPIIASDLPVHREITGGAAQFFDPFSPDELADRIVRLARSEVLRKTQIQAGLMRAATFSWTEHVNSLIDLAGSLIRQSN